MTSIVQKTQSHYNSGMSIRLVAQPNNGYNSLTMCGSVGILPAVVKNKGWNGLKKVGVVGRKNSNDESEPPSLAISPLHSSLQLSYPDECPPNFLPHSC